MGRYYDLLILTLLAVVVMALAFAGIDAPLVRALLGVPFVLVAPGYAFMVALFGQASLGVTERVLFSVGGSVAIVIVGGVLLQQTTFGLQSLSWTAVLGSMTLTAAAVAAMRRRDAPVAQRKWGWPNTLQILSLAAGFLLVLGALSIARRPAPPGGLEGYTQLWLLPATKSAEGSVRLGVRSFEFAPVNYRLQLNVGETGIQQWESITLAPGETWEEVVSIPEQHWGAGPIRGLLFRVGDPPWPPYRTVEWKSDVKPQD